MPQVFDPPDGIIITANNRVVAADFPHHISNDYMNGYRAQRLAELLDKPALTADDMRGFQLDLVCPPAREVLELLRGTGELDGDAERARHRLISWDAAMRSDSTEPLLYEAFCRRLAEHALRPLCGDAWSILAGTTADHAVFEYPGNIIGRLLPDLLRRWRSDDVSLFRGTSVGWRQVAEAALRAAGDDAAQQGGRRSRRTWGVAHRLDLTHPIARSAPRAGAILNVASFPIGGTSDTVMATTYNPAHPFRTALWAPSWRTVMDPQTWASSTGVHLGGQSGQPGSRNYGDLVGAWRTNRQHPLLWERQAVAAARRATLVLTPSVAEGPPGSGDA